jgi:hypothetical protein
MRREIIAALALFAGCSQDDANLGSGFKPVLDVPPEPIEAVDILFVIDNSGSMQEQQDALIASAGEALFDQLAAEVGGMPDIHVAVVSSDVGAGDYAITGCSNEGNDGDDGRFLIGNASCPITIDGTYLSDYDDGAGGRITNFSGTLDEAFGCAAALGTQGCGFEQHLESMRRALDGSNVANAGFLREDAILLVVILADEDDCSAFDTGVFDTSQNDIMAPLGFLNSFRCFEFGVVCDGDDPRTFGDKTGCAPRDDSAYLTTVDEYVTFLHGLKADPSMVMVAGIFGDVAPVTVIPDPEMSMRPVLDSVCPPDGSTIGTYPAVRLHALAGGFPARWVFTPICDASTEMEANLRTISTRLGTVMAAKSCLPAEVPAGTPCRGFAAPAGEARRPIAVTIAPDPEQCGPALAASVAPGSLADGDHLIVECAY